MEVTASLLDGGDIRLLTEGICHILNISSHYLTMLISIRYCFVNVICTTKPSCSLRVLVLTGIPGRVCRQCIRCCLKTLLATSCLYCAVRPSSIALKTQLCRQPSGCIKGVHLLIDSFHN